MRKKTASVVLTACVCVGLIFVSSCKKATVDTNTQTATDYSICEDEFVRILPMVNSLTMTYKGSGVERVASTPHYPTVTIDTITGWPKTMTINYGPGVTDSSDHKTRMGTIQVAFPQAWHITGTVATVSFSGYYVNNVNVVASIQLTHNTDTTFTENVESAICKTGSYVLSFSSVRTYKWLFGMGDSIAAADEYSISGIGSGADRNKVKYTFKTTKNLIWSGQCGYISEGTVDITPAGVADRIVDFGNGSCDTQATVSIEGNSFSITLQ